MKFTVIGVGQCGGRIADRFVELNNRARAQRGIEITPAVFAVNTDAADLSGLVNVPRDYQHRILIGGRRTGGHGIGKINELAAQLAKHDGDKVFDAIRGTERAFESDAFLLASSTAGGTGSGSISVLAHILKERYPTMPVFALCVLPFEHEELTEERSTYNTALCLKSVNTVADAVFVVDNQRFVGKGTTLSGNLITINDMIVEPFYDLLCAGEERNSKHIGAKTLDASDIIATISGWTAIGYGRMQISPFRIPFAFWSADFKRKNVQTQKGIQAMNKAMSELSVTCKLEDTSKALFLLTGPRGELNTDLVMEVGDYLRGLLPTATIRNGDYPRERSNIGIHIILSALSNVNKIREYYAKSVDLMPEFQRRKVANEVNLQDMEAVGKDLPLLL